MNTRFHQFVTLTALLIGAIESYGQHTYIYKFDEWANEGSIYELVNESEMILLSTLGTDEPIFGDIAVAPNGEIYGLSQPGGICLIDLESGTTTELATFSVLAGHTSFTCDSQYTCYTIDFWFNLISFNLITLEEVTLATFDEIPSGDLSFYNGRLIYPSGNGELKVIDMDTYERSVLYYFPPEMITLASIFGLGNSFHQCGAEEVIVANTNNQFFKINIEEDTFDEFNITYDIDEGGLVYGMATTDDLLASDCDGIVGVNELWESELNSPIFPNPAADIIHITNAKGVEHLQFFDLDGDLVKEISQPSTYESINDLHPGYYSVFVHHRNGKKEASKLIVLR